MIKVCETLGYTGLIVLIVDALAGHLIDEMEEQGASYRILPIPIAPHSSDQVQPLDLGLFAQHKWEFHRVSADPNLNP
jgi:hypothetical protein